MGGWLLVSLLGGLIGTIIGYFCLDGDKRNNWKNYLEYTFSWFFVVLIISGIGGSVFMLTEAGKVKNADISECEVVLVTFPIISTVREQSISGSFILGTGGISSVDKYYAYVQYDPGLKLKTFYTSDTYIVEGSHPPHYERTDYRCPATFADFFWFSTGNMRYNNGKYGQLFVPENTVLKQFSL